MKIQYVYCIHQTAMKYQRIREVQHPFDAQTDCQRSIFHRHHYNHRPHTNIMQTSIQQQIVHHKWTVYPAIDSHIQVAKWLTNHFQ